MAITYTNLAASGNTTNLSSYSSASISPTDDTAVFACFSSTASPDTTTPNVPTISGNGLTWNQLDSNTAAESTDRARITVWSAAGNASNGAVTFDLAGQTQEGASWWIFELPGASIVDIGTVGGTAVRQGADAAESSGFPSATLGSAPLSTSFVFGFMVGVDTAGGIASLTPGSGYTEALDRADFGGQRRTAGIYSLPAPPSDGVVDGDFGVTCGTRTLAFEIIEAAGAGGGAAGAVRRMMLMGCGALAKLAVPLQARAVELGDGPVLLGPARGPGGAVLL